MTQKNNDIPETPENPPNKIELETVDELREGQNEKGVNRTRQFIAYAGQLVWGPWFPIASSNINQIFHINYNPVGGTSAYGAINYYGPHGWTTLLFRGLVSISTGSPGNGYANISVCFFGKPYGSSINGSISI